MRIVSLNFLLFQLLSLVILLILVIFSNNILENWVLLDDSSCPRWWNAFFISKHLMNLKTEGVSIMIYPVKKITISVLGVDFNIRFRQNLIKSKFIIIRELVIFYLNRSRYFQDKQNQTGCKNFFYKRVTLHFYWNVCTAPPPRGRWWNEVFALGELYCGDPYQRERAIWEMLLFNLRE